MAICYLCYSKHTYMSLLLLDSLYNLPFSTTVLFIFESRNLAPIPHTPNEIGIKGGHSTATCSVHKVISFLALVLLLNKAVNLRNQSQTLVNARRIWRARNLGPILNKLL